MSANSKIEWTDHTFNPWEGCQKVGPGCDHCYAETRNARFGGGVAVNWGPGAPRRRTSISNWNLPKKWNAQAEAFLAAHGRRQRVFCSSLADVFDNAVPDDWRHDLFELIYLTPHLDWLLLTKRIGNARDMLPSNWIENPRAHVWIGATIVNQEEADRDIPKLLRTPSRVRFLSMEPLLGPVDLTDLVQKTGPGEHHYSALECDVDIEDDEWGGATVDWVIVGGESGAGARPMHPDWARSLRDQCETAGVPFLFKQWGEWAVTEQSAIHPEATRLPGNLCRVQCTSEPDHFSVVSVDGGRVRYRMDKVGKKAAGRLLDGCEWNGVPS